MLKVKILSQKDMKKKAGIVTMVAKKIELCSAKSNFRVLALLLIKLWPFSPHNLWKSDFFFWIFSSKWPPQEESKCKNA